MSKVNRQFQKERTKETLIKTAYDVFSAKGILSTRMSDIAQAAGLSHGTVFLHFSTQEALIEAVVAHYCGKIAERTHELADSRSSLRDILSAQLDGIAEYESFYTRLVIESRLLPTGARDAWVSMQSAISFHISEALRMETSTDIPAELLFNLWMGLIHYYLANGDLFAPEGNVIERYKDVFLNNYLKMIHRK